jgi:biopolymer transport protein ExbD
MSPGARRRCIATPQGRMSADINVTPLVDVVLVLLIIFMVVTPLARADLIIFMLVTPLARADLPVEVPRTTVSTAPERGASEQVVVSLDAAGQVRIDGAPVSADAYRERIGQVLRALPTGKRRLFFQADDGVNYALLVTAMDTARSAGAESLEVVTD